MGSKAVVVDVNVLRWVHLVDEGCTDLLDFITETHGPDRALGDHEQLAKHHDCGAKALGVLEDHGVSDDEVVDWMMGLSPEASNALIWTQDDPVDCRLLRAASWEKNVTLISCDYGVLRACSELGVEHLCFKAALARTDKELGGGIFDGDDYDTDQMWSPEGRDTVFYYPHARKCPPCDPDKRCECHLEVPWRHPA